MRVSRSLKPTGFAQYSCQFLCWIPAGFTFRALSLKRKSPLFDLEQVQEQLKGDEAYSQSTMAALCFIKHLECVDSPPGVLALPQACIFFRKAARGDAMLWRWDLWAGHSVPPLRNRQGGCRQTSLCQLGADCIMLQSQHSCFMLQL